MGPVGAPIDRQIRVLPDQGVGHMTCETDRQCSRQLFPQLFHGNLVPFHGNPIGGHQRGFLQGPFDLMERPPAARTSFPCIPVVQYLAYQAPVRRRLNLRQALLAAAGAFRPPGTGG